MEAVEHWTYEDFLTFLLLMAASADFNVTEKEKEAIINKVGVEEFNKVKEEFDLQNDAQRIDTISTLYRRFESRIGGKEKLINHLTEIFELNRHGVNVLDQELMIMINKIL